MALEESIEGMEKLESNGITAWVDEKLMSFLTTVSKVTIDFRRDNLGGGGYIITAGEHNCSSGEGGCSC